MDREPRDLPTASEPPAAYDDAGVDVSLIRECLDLSPAERLDLADGYAQEIESLRKLIREEVASK